jgi:hypothetical protein
MFDSAKQCLWYCLLILNYFFVYIVLPIILIQSQLHYDANSIQNCNLCLVCWEGSLNCFKKQTVIPMQNFVL